VQFSTSANKKFIRTKRSIVDEDNTLELNEGLSLDHQTSAKSSTEFIKLKEKYEDLVSRIMGINKEIQGGTKLKANAEQGKKKLLKFL